MSRNAGSASSLKFGTSGLRGLVTDLVGPPAQAWTAAFLRHMDQSGTTKRLLLVGRDLRASSPAIAEDCRVAAQALGWAVADCGALPTPALALAALEHEAAAVMVTGSHIPDDRNGLKFYAPREITKADEDAIRTCHTEDPLRAAVRGADTVRDLSGEARERYRDRYLQAFGSTALTGMLVGVYQQSSVARDLLVEVLEGLGARTAALGRAAHFVPVDTEAHRPEDVAVLRDWAGDGAYTALVSTDGDADRPLVADAAGVILRGDVLGLLVARALKLTTIVTPVTSSAAMETSGIAAEVVRTRVGSPYVIDGMDRAVHGGATGVLGFEANGGCLLGSDVVLSGGTLRALPTRDAFLPIICALLAARDAGGDLRAAADALGAGHALADRLKDIAPDASAAFLHRLDGDPVFAARFFAPVGRPAEVDRLDGLRVRLDDGAVIHYRASGNAPELRCYIEARTAERADALLRWGLAAAATEVGAFG